MADQRLLVFAATYPAPDRPHVATFIHRRVLQLKSGGFKPYVVSRHHITMGTYFSSMQRVRRFWTSPAQTVFTLDEVPVVVARIHYPFPLHHSRLAISKTQRALGPLIRELHDRQPFAGIYLATWGDFALTGSRIARELGVPYVASAIGGYENRHFGRRWSLPYRVMQEVYGFSRGVVCVSEDMRRKVDVLTAGRVPTLAFYTGVDRTIFRPDRSVREATRASLGLTASDFLVVFVGRISPKKGVVELLAAFHRLKRDLKNMHLAFVGPGNHQGWFRRSTKGPVETGRVHVLGPRPPQVVAAHLNAADLFVLPSWDEGLPNSVVEACACGTPVLASEVGGIPEILTHGESGWLIAPRDERELGEALRYLYERQDLRMELSKRAQAIVVEKFDARKNAATLSTWVQTALETGDEYGFR